MLLQNLTLPFRNVFLFSEIVAVMQKVPQRFPWQSRTTGKMPVVDLTDSKAPSSWPADCFSDVGRSAAMADCSRYLRVKARRR
jgi:hypothetical protein